MTAHLKLILNGFIIGCAIVALGTVNFMGFLLLQDEQDKMLAQQAYRQHLFQVAFELQVNFKIQVQEWKNVLIRGHQDEDYIKYLSQFIARESAVRQGIEILIEDPRVDSSIQTQAKAFLESHQSIGKAYRAALEDHDLKEPGEFKIIDTEVRGIDRPPMFLLDELVATISQVIKAEKAEAEAGMARLVKMLIILSAICLLAGILLVTYFMIDRRRYERQLSHAIQRADQANLAKSQFLAHMSHEIRTPMNGIVAAIDILKDDEKAMPEPAQEAIEIMETSSDSLTVIVNDVLDFSKIEAGKLSLRRELVDLNGFLRVLEKSLIPIVENKNLQMSFAWPRERNALIETDPVRLRQVLLNILTNAVKFTETGGISLVAEMEETGEDWVTIRFKVRDTGIGIPENKREALFKAFSQVDSSLSRRHQGSGLGLVISKAIVDAMGGEIAFTSEVGTGTEFVVTIPFTRMDGGQVRQPKTNGVHFATDKPRLETVLVVDDVKTNLIVTQRLIEKLGLTADLANSGIEAVRMARETPYDLILMDCQMPGMDGYEASRIIRSEVRNPDEMPLIIALTAHAMEEHRKESVEKGMDEHLCKPLRFQQLKECLQQFFRLSSAIEPQTPVPFKMAANR